MSENSCIVSFCGCSAGFNALPITEFQALESSLYHTPFHVYNIPIPMRNTVPYSTLRHSMENAVHDKWHFSSHDKTYHITFSCTQRCNGQIAFFRKFKTSPCAVEIRFQHYARMMESPVFLIDLHSTWW
jgi:hypothetical protein